MKSKKIQNLLKLMATFSFLIIIYYQIDLSKLWRQILEFNIYMLFWGVGIVIIGIAVSTIKLQIILAFFKIKISYLRLLKVYWAGSFFNQFLPTSFGGDIYKFYYLGKGKYSNKKGQLASSILLERAIGVYSSIIFALGTFFFFENRISIYLRVIFLVVTLFLVLLPFIVMNRNDESLLSSEKKKNSFYIWNKIRKIYKIVLKFNDKSKMLVSLFISILFTILCVLIVYISFRAIGYNIDIKILLYLVPVINLAKMIPISIDSIGVKEELGILLFALYGIAAEIVLLALIFSRLTNTITSLTGGLIYLVLKFDEND